VNHTSIYKYLIINIAEDLIEHSDRDVLEQHRPDAARYLECHQPGNEC
jgi:hypothetical protein